MKDPNLLLDMDENKILKAQKVLIFMKRKKEKLQMKILSKKKNKLIRHN